jgi:hypothetical protein
MNRDAALRRLRALRNLSLDKGAFPAEVESAKSLIRLLEERYSIEDEGPQKERGPVPDWTYWNWILNEFGIEGRRFHKSASANLDSTRIIVIRLDSGEWQVQRKTHAGYQTVAHNRNPESLREYLQQNGPRKYSLATVAA